MSTLYPLAKQALLQGNQFNLLTDNLKAGLVDTGTYVYSDAHQYWNAASAAAVGTPIALSNKTLNVPAPGVFDADDLLFASLVGASFEAIIIYKDTGNPALSPMLAFLDGFSVLPQGNDVIVVWDQGPFRIFSL